MVVQRNRDPSKIHSYAYRANELATFALTLFAVMCGIASLSDNFNVPNPTVDVKILDINWFQKQPHGNDEISDINWFQKQPHGNDEILDINWFQKQPHGNDEVSLTLNISADLQSMFTWNTKQIFVFVAAEYATPQNALNQVSLWDGIITSKEHAKFHIHTTNKYGFIDQGSNLRGKEFNMTLHWHVMPKTGKMFADKIVTTGYRLPYNYYLPDKYR